MHQEFGELLQKYLANTSTSEEEELLFGLIRSGGFDRELAHIIAQDAKLKKFLSDHPEEIGARSYSKIKEAIELKIQSPATVRKSFWQNFPIRYVAAAIILLAMASSAWWWFAGESQPVAVTMPSQPSGETEDVMPGTNKAVLTLSSGEKIVLSGGREILDDGGVRITKTGDALLYGETTILAYNTMTTPRGGQYRLTLSDGTRVWLNAASSVTYPTTFNGDERRVEVTGETYFEVAPDKSRPFVVTSPRDEISVLGTHFNVNAYLDEPASIITVLEGSVRVNDEVLKRGESYRAGNVSIADTGQAVAWKNGVFNFHKLPLENVMRQLSRWYDISVEYPLKVPDITVGGKMGRDLNLSQVLEVLAEMNVHYKMKNKQLLILP